MPFSKYGHQLADNNTIRFTTTVRVEETGNLYVDSYDVQLDSPDCLTIEVSVSEVCCCLEHQNSSCISQICSLIGFENKLQQIQQQRHLCSFHKETLDLLECI